MKISIRCRCLCIVLVGAFLVFANQLFAASVVKTLPDDIVASSMHVSALGIIGPDDTSRSSPVRLDTLGLLSAGASDGGRATKHGLAAATKHPNALMRNCGNATFGAHHKMGTVLANNLARRLCMIPFEDVHWHAKPEHFSPGSPFIHFIRDPLETFISGYQYHLISSEKWLQTNGYQARLRNMSVKEGLEMEFQWAVASTIREAIVMHNFLNQPSLEVDSFTVRLDDMRTEDNFKLVVASLENYLGLDHLPWDAFRECCFKSSADGKHIMDRDEKEGLREIVMLRHAKEIASLRQQLGFRIQNSRLGLRMAGSVYGRRTKPVEPKHTELQNNSLCVTYSEEHDVYNWTTDEGRCIYERFVARSTDCNSGNTSAPCTVLEMGVIQGSADFGISHSYAYQYGLGWNTILIEANPEMEPHIRNNRPGATLHMVPVCEEPANLHFVMTTAAGLNGFEEFMDDKLFQHKLKQFDAAVVRKIPMQCKPMMVLLEDVPVIDVFFLDVEGAELSVLQTMDFKRTCVQLLNIEDGHPSSAVGGFLRSKGYSHVGWNTEKWNHVWLNSVKCR